ncbi:MAG: hypothetical protein ABSB33_14180, partial [Tepidisphaeraceae bacterium]
LAARRIRAIGSPAERFGEDHLRMLRAVRFAARFGFEIEPATTAAIQLHASRIKGISPERIGEELRLMLTPPTRFVAWALLWDLHLAREIFRFLPAVPEALDPARSIFLKLEKGRPVSLGLSLAAACLCTRLQGESRGDVLPLLAKNEISCSVRAMRQALRISNDEGDEMAQTLANLEPLLQSSSPTLARKKRFLAHPKSGLSRQLMESIASVGLHQDRIATLQAELAGLSLQDVAPAPLLDGNELIAAGFSPGPAFRRILDAVYDAQLEGRISTKEEAMKLAKTL